MRNKLILLLLVFFSLLIFIPKGLSKEYKNEIVFYGELERPNLLGEKKMVIIENENGEKISLLIDEVELVDLTTKEIVGSFLYTPQDPFIYNSITNEENKSLWKIRKFASKN